MIDKKQSSSVGPGLTVPLCDQCPLRSVRLSVDLHPAAVRPAKPILQCFKEDPAAYSLPVSYILP